MLAIDQYYDSTKGNINKFFFGLALYSVGAILSYFIDIRLAQVLQVLALIPFCWFGIKLVDVRVENSYFKVFFTVLIIYHILVIIRGFVFTYESIKEYLFYDYKFWPYLIPFTALFIKDISFFKRMFNWFFFGGILFLLLSILFQKVQGLGEYSISWFSSGCGFILLTWKYHSKKKQAIAVVVVILALYFATVLARRNAILTVGNFVIFSYLLYIFYYSKGNILQKIISFLLITLFLLSGILFFEEKKNSDFELITNRALEDTRQDVFDYYFKGMKDDMWFGKGMSGTYYCPLIVPDTDSDFVFYRDVIECGYFQIILNGGLINLLLFLLIALPAVFLGFFYSKNGLTKACSIIILLWLIDMVPYGLPMLSIRYVLFWIAIGVCYSKTIRQISEEDMNDYFLETS